MWFIKINVIRDHYVLHGQETSAWDGWRSVSSSNRVIDEQEVALLARIIHRVSGGPRTAVAEGTVFGGVWDAMIGV
jgi:hypothetical protein